MLLQKKPRGKNRQPEEAFSHTGPCAGELWQRLRTHGIDVAQVGHDRELFPGFILISQTDRRAAAASVCVCKRESLGRRGETAELSLSAVAVK